MRLERILSLKGGRAQTQNGFFNIIGNAHFSAGEVVPMFDGHVIGRQNQISKRPSWEFTAPVAEESGVEPEYLLVAYDDGTYDLFDPSTLETITEDPVAFANWPSTWIVTMENSGKYISDYCFANNGEYMGLLIVVQDSNDSDAYYYFDLRSAYEYPVFAVTAGKKDNYHGFYFEITDDGVPCFGGINEIWVSGEGTILYAENCVNGTLSSRPCYIDAAMRDGASSKVSDQRGWADQNRHIDNNFRSEYVRNEYGGTWIQRSSRVPGGYGTVTTAIIDQPASVSTTVTDEGVDSDGYDGYSWVGAGNPKTGMIVADCTWSGVRHFSFNSAVDCSVITRGISLGTTETQIGIPVCSLRYTPVNPAQYIQSPSNWNWPITEYGSIDASSPEFQALQDQSRACLAQNQYELQMVNYTLLDTTPGEYEHQMALVYYYTWQSGSVDYGVLGLKRWEQTGIDGNGMPVMGWVSNGWSSDDGWPWVLTGSDENGTGHHLGPFHGYNYSWISSFPYCCNYGQQTDKKYTSVSVWVRSADNSSWVETFDDKATSWTQSYSVGEFITISGQYLLNIDNPSAQTLVTNSLTNQIRGQETYYPRQMEQSITFVNHYDYPWIGPPDYYDYDNPYLADIYNYCEEYVTYGCLYYGDGPTGSGTGSRTIEASVDGGEVVTLDMPYTDSTGNVKLQLLFDGDGRKTIINDKIPPISYSSGSPPICLEVINGSVLLMAYGRFFKETADGFELVKGGSGNSINTVLRAIKKSILE